MKGNCAKDTFNDLIITKTLTTKTLFNFYFKFKKDSIIINTKKISDNFQTWCDDVKYIPDILKVSSL